MTGMNNQLSQSEEEYNNYNIKKKLSYYFSQDIVRVKDKSKPTCTSSQTARKL